MALRLALGSARKLLESCCLQLVHRCCLLHPIRRSVRVRCTGSPVLYQPVKKRLSSQSLMYDWVTHTVCNTQGVTPSTLPPCAGREAWHSAEAYPATRTRDSYASDSVTNRMLKFLIFCLILLSLAKNRKCMKNQIFELTQARELVFYMCPRERWKFMRKKRNEIARGEETRLCLESVYLRCYGN